MMPSSSPAEWSGSARCRGGSCAAGAGWTAPRSPGGTAAGTAPRSARSASAPAHRSSAGAARRADSWPACYRSSRFTNFDLTGSFAAASASAWRARCSSIPSSSNMMRPGFTTATHPSGLPLPFPIRVSAGFLVIGLSGNSRIHTLPPRFISRVNATRAASIWRFEIHPGSSVISPYWPNATVLPRVAIPDVRPLNRLRNLTRLGASIASRSRRVGPPRQLLGHLACEDPYLHADGAVGGLGGGRRVVDVGAQRVQRHAALVVPFRARDFGAAQTPGALDLDPLRAHAHRALHRALHGAAERDALVQLVHHTVADQLGVELGALDLLDVDADFLAGELRQLVAQLVDLRATLADHHSRPPRVDRHRHLARLALDVHFGDRRVREPRLQVLADQVVFLEELGKIALGEVPRPPRLDDPESEPVGMRFLSHVTCPRSSCAWCDASPCPPRPWSSSAPWPSPWAAAAPSPPWRPRRGRPAAPPAPPSRPRGSRRGWCAS